jgi:opacity protein-like surface antigen
MRRRWSIGAFVVGCWLAGTSAGWAQVAVGIEGGAYIPAHVEFDVAPIFGGFFESYLTRSLAVRAELGWAESAHTGARVDAVRIIPLWVGLDYNWAITRYWHPYIGAGIGPYFLQAKRDGHSFGDSQTKLGLNIGGGIEYRLNRNVGIQGELRYHGILRTVTGLDPSGLSVTGGLKAYF